MSVVVTTDGLAALVVALGEDGRRVVAPVAHDGVIGLDEIDRLDDVACGWADAQEPGRYRAVRRDTGELFGQAAPAIPWKRYLFPERTLLVSIRRDDGAFDVVEPDPPTDRYAFFGIRACDLRSLAVLDRVFLDSAATDPTYAALRAELLVVAVTCSSPASTCFCASMGGGPIPDPGADLALTEIDVTGDHRFLVDAGTARGQELIDAVPHRPAEPDDLELALAVGRHATASMGRTLDPADPPLAAARLDHPRWHDVADRCLSCANCTMVCPTCFCSTTEDTTDLAGIEAQRWRRWDSCFTLDFSYLHGGSVRQSGMSRYRQWLLHKLVTWHDQFGTSGCVGCGRCITWCPVGIDLTEEVAVLAREGAPA